MKKFVSIAALIAVSMFMLIGCGGAEVAQNDCFDGAPKWVDMGGAAYPGDGGKALYGVGIASKSVNRSAMNNQAKMRATADLASQIQTYVAQLKKDYLSSTSDGNAEALESQFTMATKQITKMTLSGGQKVDAFRDKCNSDLHVLVRLDLDAMKEAMDKVESLNAKVKDYISKNADRAHDELKAAEESH